MLEVQELIVKPKIINSLFRNKEIDLQELDEETSSLSTFVNLITEDKKQSALCLLVRGERPALHYMNTKDLEYQGWRPRDREQTCYFWSLKYTQGTVCLGAAGTGKTSIALAYGLRHIFKEGKKLILCKPTVFVGKKSNAIAAVPGDERDKLGPYVDSYMPGLKKILGRDAANFLYEWEEKDLLEFRAIELMRGQHFENCTLIIDEAQNLSLHELISVMSRVDLDSKLILLGDPDQIDTGEAWEETGLGILVNSTAVQNSELVSCIKLSKQYRGPMAELCQQVLEEQRES